MGQRAVVHATRDSTSYGAVHEPAYPPSNRTVPLLLTYIHQLSSLHPDVPRPDIRPNLMRPLVLPTPTFPAPEHPAPERKLYEDNRPS